jgi:mRNA-degrading endonuclease RelE of RelBE toxin-antitoxin system
VASAARRIQGSRERAHLFRTAGARTPAEYRIRVGDYRVLYEIADTILRVLVVKVRHRRDVYE